MDAGQADLEPAQQHMLRMSPQLKQSKLEVAALGCYCAHSVSSDHTSLESLHCSWRYVYASWLHGHVVSWAAWKLNPRLKPRSEFGHNVDVLGLGFRV